MSNHRAIIIAGVLIAGAVFYSSGKKQIGENNAETGGVAINIKPIAGQDHILGNPDAPVKIVEFSDTECPFCKRFHTTLKQVIDEYGKKGQVAWIYRHFPLDAIHSKARKEAEAAECANELGGNGTPWSIVVAQNGKKFPLSGAQPYSAVKALIEAALQEK